MCTSIRLLMTPYSDQASHWMWLVGPLHPPSHTMLNLSILGYARSYDTTSLFIVTIILDEFISIIVMQSHELFVHTMYNVAAEVLGGMVDDIELDALTRMCGELGREKVWER